jgi:hypothetical protein
MPRGVVHALALVKRVSAEVNRDLGALDEPRAPLRPTLGGQRMPWHGHVYK